MGKFHNTVINMFPKRPGIPVTESFARSQNKSEKYRPILSQETNNKDTKELLDNPGNCLIDISNVGGLFPVAK